MTDLIVRVLDRDPDLGAGLDAREFAVARQHALARLRRYSRGSWAVGAGDFDGDRSVGLLIIGGLLVRKVTVGDRAFAELLGPGDVTQPWLTLTEGETVAADVNWRVEHDLQVAVLDRAFTARVCRWTEIPAAIFRRAMLRVHWLSFHVSVCHIRRVDERLLLVMWHLAGRWGRVTPEGVEISLPLTHSLLALVVGAHRPSVTVGLHALERSGHLRHRARARWLLQGKPPAELRKLHEHAARHVQPLPGGFA